MKGESSYVLTLNSFVKKILVCDSEHSWTLNGAGEVSPPSLYMYYVGPFISEILNESTGIMRRKFIYISYVEYYQGVIERSHLLHCHLYFHFT